MKVIVTGGCGFLGSHVCEYFLKLGHQVISIDNMTKHELNRTGFAPDAARSYNWNYLEKIGVKMVLDDVRNLDSLLDHASGCDYIIHTAAQPAMTISWEEPLLDIESNVMGTFNCLETARRHNIPIASCASVHVYGNSINGTLKEGNNRWVRNPIGIDENYPVLGGVLTPLHASKATGDLYTKVYIDTYKLRAASFRLTGIYGTRQFGGEDHGWVANFSIRALMNWPITIFGKGWQVRDIIYATDVCEAFEAFYFRGKPGIYNIGGGEKTAISLLDCIDIIKEITQIQPDVRFEDDRHGDLRYFVCDIGKAKNDLAWSPKVMPRDGIELLINWISENKTLFEINKNLK